jgi:hypothetical protein
MIFISKDIFALHKTNFFGQKYFSHFRTMVLKTNVVIQDESNLSKKGF